MSDTPLYDAVAQIVRKNRARFYMPGHKGRGDHPFYRSMLSYDITEIEGADALCHPSGAIQELEHNLADLYGAQQSLLSAGGSTLCIQTMFALIARRGKTVLAARNVHAAAVNAMGLLQIQPVWVPMRQGRLCADDVEQALRAHPEVAAVYLTSPDYYGRLSDIAAISQTAHQHGAVVAVDNAHGAHLKFCTPDLHPISLGADLCCDSLHKTLPALTGAAVLHIRDPRIFAGARETMDRFMSTSPSYLIMISADLAVGMLRNEGKEQIERVCKTTAAIRTSVKEGGIPILWGPQQDPMRICCDFAAYGYEREGFAAHLQKAEIEAEYLSGTHGVFLLSPNNTPDEFSRLERFLRELPRAGKARSFCEEVELPAQAMEISRAQCAAMACVAVEEAPGQISAETVAPCPPGMPIVIPGERISEKTATILKTYGIFSILVVK